MNGDKPTENASLFPAVPIPHTRTRGSDRDGQQTSRFLITGKRSSGPSYQQLSRQHTPPPVYTALRQHVNMSQHAANTANTPQTQQRPAVAEGSSEKASGCEVLIDRIEQLAPLRRYTSPSGTSVKNVSKRYISSLAFQILPATRWGKRPRCIEFNTRCLPVLRL